MITILLHIISYTWHKSEAKVEFLKMKSGPDIGAVVAAER